MSSSEMFKSREDEFREKCDDMWRKLMDQMPTCTRESQEQLCRDLERSLEEASILIQEMELEILKAPTAFRMPMISKVQDCRKEVEQLSLEIKYFSAAEEQNTLLASSQPPSYDELKPLESVQHAQLMHGMEGLYRNSDSLACSLQASAATDHDGHETVGESSTRRESLIRAINELQQEEMARNRNRAIRARCAKIACVCLLLKGILISVALMIKVFDSSS